jgi:DNA-binding transcriptional LysR family regulator
MKLVNLDMDALRTLVTAQQLGSFNRAASQIGRSQSAVSQQIHKLEEQIGEPLFRKHGRGLALTNAGDVVVAYARRILDLNDETVLAARGHAIEGVVRFGLPADFAESWLPTVLGRFKRSHPSVQIEVVVDRNRRLLERLDNGELDLVLALDNASRSDSEAVASLPLVWIGPAADVDVWRSGEPIPLAMYEAPCFFRQRALAALDQAGLSWRIAFSSSSLRGLWAAVEAGLGVTLRTTIGLPSGLRALNKINDLPPAPKLGISLGLHDGKRTMSSAAKRFRSIVVETLENHLPIQRRYDRAPLG